MGRRAWSLALASLALAVPATASAKEVEPYKVLVVTSTADDVSAAGIAAITSAVGADGVVEAPAPADVGGKFTAEGLDAYRTVVFLNTGQASPLNDTQRGAFEAYYKKGGGYVGIGSAIETDTSWQFMTDLLGTRSSGRTASQSATIKVIDRVHDASKNLAQYWDRTESYYNFAANVRGKSHVLASRRRGSLRQAAAGQGAQRHRGRHHGCRPPDLVVQGLQRRPLLLHGPRHQRRGLRRRAEQAPQGRDRVGRGAEQPGLQRLRRHRADELPADEDRRPAERG